MPRTITRTVYTLAELNTMFPQAYERVHARWVKACDESGDVPWSSETMASLKAVVAACGGTIKDYSIGPYSPSYLRILAEDYTEREDGSEGSVKDAAWLRREVLKPKGYTKKNGHAYFPGLCAWTGYCADDHFIQAIYTAMRDGDTLTEALEGLADVAAKVMEDDADQDRNAETMLANWGDNYYDEDGEEVPEPKPGPQPAPDKYETDRLPD